MAIAVAIAQPARAQPAAAPATPAAPIGPASSAPVAPALHRLTAPIKIDGVLVGSRTWITTCNSHRC